MTERTTFTGEEARRPGQEIGIDWTSAPFDLRRPPFDEAGRVRRFAGLR